MSMELAGGLGDHSKRSANSWSVCGSGEDFFSFTLISHLQRQDGFSLLGTFSENRMASRAEGVTSLPVVTGPFVSCYNSL